MIKSLFVFWNDQRVGKFGISAPPQFSYFCFRYDREYLSNKQAKAISLSLPLQGEIIDTIIADNFLNNLLPEGDLKKHIAEIKKCSTDNDLALLGILGGDCAGALTFSVAQNLSCQNFKPVKISDEKLNTLISDKSQPLLLANRMSRLTLAGAQSKIPLTLRDGQLYLPNEFYPSSHIFKPESDRFPDLVENEHFCMSLARLLGLNVPRTSIWEGPSKKGLLVERYDREQCEEGIARLHQEDFCQALGVKSIYKYEADGGPSLQQCYRLLRDHSTEPLIDLPQLLRWACFNYLIGNADAHGKNISLIHYDTGIRLAPFYDLISTDVYEDLSPWMAMRVGGVDRIDCIQKRHWERLAADLNIKPKVILDMLEDMATKLPIAVTQMSNEMDSSSKTLQALISKSTKRTGQTLRYLKNTVGET